MSLKNTTPFIKSALLSRPQQQQSHPGSIRAAGARPYTPPPPPLKSSPSLSSSPSSKEASLCPAYFKPRLVIFDKDGTLVCFHTMWTPWCTSLAQRMQKVTGLDLSAQLYDVLGYDQSSRRVRIGALAENTHPQIRSKIEVMLQQDRGFSPGEARKAVESSWMDMPENLQIKTTGDVGVIFEALQREDIKVAICTSDSREGTMAFLAHERLDRGLVDMVVCGDDLHSKPKPHPHNALLICRELGVRPSETIMVGDTPADTLMGQQANLGLTVGVLSGIGREEDLTDADVIVADVGECLEMILPLKEEAARKKRVYQVTDRGLSKIAQGSWHLEQNSRRGFSTAATAADVSAQRDFSHVVVGAGSAGCVMANRLTEDRDDV